MADILPSPETDAAKEASRATMLDATRTLETLSQRELAREERAHATSGATSLALSGLAVVLVTVAVHQRRAGGRWKRWLLAAAVAGVLVAVAVRTRMASGERVEAARRNVEQASQEHARAEAPPEPAASVTPLVPRPARRIGPAVATPPPQCAHGDPLCGI